MINIVQILEDEVLVDFFADDKRKFRLVFFVLDELVEETEAARNCGEFRFFRELAEDDAWEVKYNPNAVIIVLIKVEQVKS